MEPSSIAALFERTVAEIGKVLIGQAELVEATVVALCCEGHVLIEGVPGLGKTLLVNALSRVLSCPFRRIQFTPDLMPSDITGHNVYDLQERRFNFNPGPIFTSLLLADEINRAPAKTQSALLEAMQERQVTVDGHVYPLQPPFITIATQNPLEQEGTYPLPEAQLDRFMFKLLVNYPAIDEEARILANYARGHDHRRLDSYGLRQILSAEHVVAIQQSLIRVIVEQPIIEYITKLVAKTREWPAVEVGASPRASVNLLLGSRALAACHGRNYVVPDDVKQLAPWVLRHRLRLNPEAEIDGTSVEGVIQDILDAVAAPQPAETPGAAPA
jgi:MoxR-like ATPase